MWKWFRDKQDLFNENEDLKREVSRLKSSCNSLEREIKYTNKGKDVENGMLRARCVGWEKHNTYLKSENERLESTLDILLSRIKDLPTNQAKTTTLLNEIAMLREERSDLRAALNAAEEDFAYEIKELQKDLDRCSC